MSNLTERASQLVAKMSQLTTAQYIDESCSLIADLLNELKQVRKDAVDYRNKWAVCGLAATGVPYINYPGENASLEDVLKLLASLEQVESEKTALEQQVMRDGIAFNKCIKNMVDRVNALEAENKMLEARLERYYESPSI